MAQNPVIIILFICGVEGWRDERISVHTPVWRFGPTRVVRETACLCYQWSILTQLSFKTTLIQHWQRRARSRGSVCVQAFCSVARSGRRVISYILVSVGPMADLNVNVKHVHPSRPYCDLRRTPFLPRNYPAALLDPSGSRSEANSRYTETHQSP